MAVKSGLSCYTARMIDPDLLQRRKQRGLNAATLGFFGVFLVFATGIKDLLESNGTTPPWSWIPYLGAVAAALGVRAVLRILVDAALAQTEDAHRLPEDRTASSIRGSAGKPPWKRPAARGEESSLAQWLRVAFALIAIGIWLFLPELQSAFHSFVHPRTETPHPHPSARLAPSHPSAPPAPSSARDSSPATEKKNETWLAHAPKAVVAPPLPPQAKEFLDRAQREPSPCPELLARAEERLAAARSVQALDALIRDLTLCKWKRRTYQETEIGRKNWLLGAIPRIPWPEERWIRKAILAAAEQQKPPADAKVHLIPVVRKAPVIDGVLQKAEWAHALILGAPGSQSRILFETDGRKLYIAADVPEDTKDGSRVCCPEMQLIWHPGLTPLVRGQYLFIYRHGKTSAGYRSLLAIKLRGSAENKFTIAYDHAALAAPSGTTHLNGHRQYELALPIDAAALPRGHPFSIGVVLELAALYRVDAQTGKPRFVRRRYVHPFDEVFSDGWMPRWRIWLKLPSRTSNPTQGDPQPPDRAPPIYSPPS